MYAEVVVFFGPGIRTSARSSSDPGKDGTGEVDGLPGGARQGAGRLWAIEMKSGITSRSSRPSSAWWLEPLIVTWAYSTAFSGTNAIVSFAGAHSFAAETWQGTPGIGMNLTIR